MDRSSKLSCRTDLGPYPGLGNAAVGALEPTSLSFFLTPSPYGALKAFGMQIILL